MTICDRCEGRGNVKEVTVHVYIGPEPITKTCTIAWGKDLCERCRGQLQDGIDALLTTEAKQAAKL